MRRTILTAGGVIVTLAVLVVFLLARERYARLAEEHQRVQVSTDMVLNTMTDAVIAITAQGKVTLTNEAAEKLFGFQSHDVVGLSYIELFPNDRLGLQEALDLQRDISSAEMEWHNGRSKHFLAVATSLLISRGKGIDGAVAVIRDNTERHTIQEQLRRRERMSAMGELASGFAHEIRNPLNAIGIITQRFAHEFVPVGEEEEFQRLLKTVRKEIQRVNGIVAQFLDFARPAKLEKTDSSLSEILRASIDVIESQATIEGINIELIIEDEERVLLDREKMKQVFLNLLQNAIEAIEQDGAITCKIQRSGVGEIVVSIIDSGSGIHPDIRERVFNLYFTTKSTGTGLGLSLVHQIVTEHDGNIFVESSEGNGTTFVMTFPVPSRPT